MASTFEIHQDRCNGCETCVPVANGEIAINSNVKAYFTSTGEAIATVGTEVADYVLTAISVCPEQCIEETG